MKKSKRKKQSLKILENLRPIDDDFCAVRSKTTNRSYRMYYGFSPVKLTLKSLNLKRRKT